MTDAPQIKDAGDILRLHRGDPDAARRALDEVAANEEPIGGGALSSLLSSHDPKAVRWLWPGYIPRGKLTLLDGDPGLSKSTVAIDIAARVTRGAWMPDHSRSDLGEPRHVIMLSAEDDPADTIRPRADRAEADPSRIVLWHGVHTRQGEPPRMPTLGDIQPLRALVDEYRAALIIIDPLMAYLGGDAHRDNEVRQGLAPLAQLAAETGAAVLVVRHLNKSGGTNAVYRGGGSIGIIGAARVGLLIARDPDDETGARRILAVSKSNLAATAPSLAYHIETVDDAPRIVWDGTTQHTASSILVAPTEEDGEAPGSVSEASEFLRSLLADGPVPARDAIKQARSVTGVSERTLKRARKALGIKANKTGMNDGWEWHLPGGSRIPEEDHTPSWPPSDPFDGNGDSPEGTEKGQASEWPPSVSRLPAGYDDGGNR